jgi:hypothetical protein
MSEHDSGTGSGAPTPQLSCGDGEEKSIGDKCFQRSRKIAINATGSSVCRRPLRRAVSRTVRGVVSGAQACTAANSVLYVHGYGSDNNEDVSRVH